MRRRRRYEGDRCVPPRLLDLPGAELEHAPVAGGPCNETIYRIPLKHRHTGDGRMQVNTLADLFLDSAYATHAHRISDSCRAFGEALPALAPTTAHCRRGPSRSVVSGVRRKGIGGEQGFQGGLGRDEGGRSSGAPVTSSVG